MRFALAAPASVAFFGTVSDGFLASQDGAVYVGAFLLFGVSWVLDRFKQKRTNRRNMPSRLPGQLFQSCRRGTKDEEFSKIFVLLG
jgi:hypothetical protein